MRTVRPGIPATSLCPAEAGQGTKGLLRNASLGDFGIVQTSVLVKKDGEEILLIGSGTGQYNT